MSFQRITRRVLPDGTEAFVYPFHVCTEGQEDRLLAIDEDDFRVAHNYIPICARRANVIVVTDCVLGTHMHAEILAACYNDAVNFSNSYKLSMSKYLDCKYGKGKGLLNRVSAKPILLEDNFHVRNTICYIARNALDMGERVDRYEWSSFRALFCNGKIERPVKPIKELSARKIRELLKTSDKLQDTGWMINDAGAIEPASYCDWRYAESAFNNDPSFFMRILGTTDDKQMEQMLVRNQIRSKSNKELIIIAQEKAMKRYGKPLEQLSLEEKIPLAKLLYHSLKTYPAQLSRCLGVDKDKMEWILKTQNFQL